VFYQQDKKFRRKLFFFQQGTPKNKAELLEDILTLKEMGLKFYGTKGTSDYYKLSDIDVEILYRPFDEKEPSILAYLGNGEIDMVINIPKSAEKVELDSDYIIRRKAVDLNIPLFTNVQATKRFIKALQQFTTESLPVKSWDEYS
jgi:carbamoyl-phosphate synthase large subunit